MFAFFKNRNLKTKIISVTITLSFFFTSIIPQQVLAQVVPINSVNLPAPGTFVGLSQEYLPPIIRGVQAHPDNPLMFTFLVDSGEDKIAGQEFKDESTKMIKYFLAAMTIPEEKMWVNLSPYEKNRIIGDGFGGTEMGKDLLAQDYILKQLTASLIYPENSLGKKFWMDVYKKVYEKYGSVEVPINTFNKVWIVPDKATVYEHGTGAYVVERHLKVMLEQDYLAQRMIKEETEIPDPKNIASIIIKQIIIPAIETEVNTGKHFANLRQIYNAMILATWYKMKMRETLLGKIYVDKSKIKGVDNKDPKVNQKIYDQYLAAFKKGVYNYIKEDYDPAKKEVVSRKYFSGGAVGLKKKMMRFMPEGSSLTPRQESEGFGAPDAAMRAVEVDLAEIGKDISLQDRIKKATTEAIKSSNDSAMVITHNPIGKKGLDTNPPMNKDALDTLIQIFLFDHDSINKMISNIKITEKFPIKHTFLAKFELKKEYNEAETHLIMEELRKYLIKYIPDYDITSTGYIVPAKEAKNDFFSFLLSPKFDAREISGLDLEDFEYSIDSLIDNNITSKVDFTFYLNDSKVVSIHTKEITDDNADQIKIAKKTILRLIREKLSPDKKLSYRVNTSGIKIYTKKVPQNEATLILSPTHIATLQFETATDDPKNSSTETILKDVKTGTKYQLISERLKDRKNIINHRLLNFDGTKLIRFYEEEIKSDFVSLDNYAFQLYALLPINWRDVINKMSKEVVTKKAPDPAMISFPDMDANEIQDWITKLELSAKKKPGFDSGLNYEERDMIYDPFGHEFKIKIVNLPIRGKEVKFTEAALINAGIKNSVVGTLYLAGTNPKAISHEKITQLFIREMKKLISDNAMTSFSGMNKNEIKDFMPILKFYLNDKPASDTVSGTGERTIIYGPFSHRFIVKVIEKIENEKPVKYTEFSLIKAGGGNKVSGTIQLEGEEPKAMSPKKITELFISEMEKKLNDRAMNTPDNHSIISTEGQWKNIDSLLEVISNFHEILWSAISGNTVLASTRDTILMLSDALKNMSKKSPVDISAQIKDLVTAAELFRLTEIGYGPKNDAYKTINKETLRTTYSEIVEKLKKKREEIVRSYFSLKSELAQDFIRSDMKFKFPNTSLAERIEMFDDIIKIIGLTPHLTAEKIMTTIRAENPTIGMTTLDFQGGADLDFNDILGITNEQTTGLTESEIALIKFFGNQLRMDDNNPYYNNALAFFAYIGLNKEDKKFVDDEKDTGTRLLNALEELANKKEAVSRLEPKRLFSDTAMIVNMEDAENRMLSTGIYFERAFNLFINTLFHSKKFDAFGSDGFKALFESYFKNSQNIYYDERMKDLTSTERDDLFEYLLNELKIIKKNVGSTFKFDKYAVEELTQGKTISYSGHNLSLTEFEKAYFKILIANADKLSNVLLSINNEYVHIEKFLKKRTISYVEQTLINRLKAEILPGETISYDVEIDDQVIAIEVKTETDKAMIDVTAESTKAPALLSKPGGIDLNSKKLDLQIKRDGNDVTLPLKDQPVKDINIEGFIPVIIKITPVYNLPMTLGLNIDDNITNKGKKGDHSYIKPSALARNSYPG